MKKCHGSRWHLSKRMSRYWQLMLSFMSVPNKRDIIWIWLTWNALLSKKTEHTRMSPRGLCAQEADMRFPGWWLCQPVWWVCCCSLLPLAFLSSGGISEHRDDDKPQDQSLLLIIKYFRWTEEMQKLKL